jgi:hypothetical protein
MYFSVKETAELMRTTVPTVYSWMKKGWLPYHYRRTSPFKARRVLTYEDLSTLYERLFKIPGDGSDASVLGAELSAKMRHTVMKRWAKARAEAKNKDR